MQDLPSLEELKARIGKKVSIAGWVHDVRSLGGISFVLLRNSKGIVQIAAPKKALTAELFEMIQSLHQEDVISCEGTVKESRAARMGFEVLPEKVVVLSKSAAPLPLDPRGVTPAGLDTRLLWRSLELRRPQTAAVFKVENAVVEAFEEFLRGRGFMRAFTPSILGGISEGGSDVFKIDYYGRPAFLRQDPQLHRQLTVAGGFDRIYDLGPNWRAELSHTPRHLSEHRTIAPEMAFISDERDVMQIEEQMVAHAVSVLTRKCADELATLKLELEVPRTPFPEITFPNLYDILASNGKRLPRNEDLDEEAKDILATYVRKKLDSDFFFVNRFPAAPKPFYIMKVDEEPEFARSTDLFFGSLELSSGGQREHRHDKILAQIKEKGMDANSLKWFTEPFRYGVPSHGGYSFGIERFVAHLLKLESIKEAVLFPRDPERLEP
ncbi:MAG: aspartate--tRNA(Asn) ligase [Nitrososphaerales archaeon]|nr:aspartate--tRNA(Asn) ligase [Nitrososphaerales archaeon]